MKFRCYWPVAYDAGGRPIDCPRETEGMLCDMHADKWREESEGRGLAAPVPDDDNEEGGFMSVNEGKLLGGGCSICLRPIQKFGLWEICLYHGASLVGSSQNPTLPLPPEPAFPMAAHTFGSTPPPPKHPR